MHAAPNARRRTSAQRPPAAARGAVKEDERRFQLARRAAYQAVIDRDWPAAVEGFRALSDDPRYGAGEAVGLCTALTFLERHDDAELAARHALALEPGNPKAVHLLTLALIALNRWSEALVWFERFRDGPLRQHLPFVMNHGSALAHLGHPQEALGVLLEAAVLCPHDVALHMKIGTVLRDLKMFTESAEAFVTAYTLEPGRIAARLMAVHMRQHACDWRDFDAHRQALIEAIEAVPVDTDGLGEGGVFSLVSIDTPLPVFYRAARQAVTRHVRKARPLPPVAWRRGPGDRIRLGYLSNDFHNHATAILFVESLEHRDRSRFEVTFYSHSRDDASAMQHRVRAACDRYVDIGMLNDADAAQRIRDDGIDLLVDLKGHTHGNRLGIFAFRPAPLQVSFLGYPGTSGADFIDYVVGDRQVTPMEHQPWYSERIAQMPECYQPNDSRRARPAPVPRAALGLPAHAPVLACFNQAFKLTPETWGVWMRLLMALPDAVLWLLEDNDQASANLRRHAQSHGVDPARLLFAPRIAHEDNLARLPAADLMLDNWPCNAHTTAGDALWMGLPVLTVQGEPFAARVAGSLLHALGLPELVCHDAAGYEATALALLREPARLRELRERLQRNAATHSLFDGRRHARALEALYLRMAERAAQGLAPAPLAAEPEARACDRGLPMASDSPHPQSALAGPTVAPARLPVRGLAVAPRA
jgi:predicted O-linked N-acetylglucosamine transferase (SPINDLY family)